VSPPATDPAAVAVQYPARVAKEKSDILMKLPKNVRDIAWNAQPRLRTRYRSMTAKGKKPTVIVTAIARELAGFIWAIGQKRQACDEKHSCGDQPADGSLSDCH